MSTLLGPVATGRVSFVALYPYDTRVVFRLPVDEPGPNTVDAVCAELNQARILTAPPGVHEGESAEFMVERPREFFKESQNITWAVIRADLPGNWFERALTEDQPQLSGLSPSVTATLRLFDGGTVTLGIEVNLTCDLSTAERESDFAGSIDRIADDLFRQNDETTKFFGEYLEMLGKRLRQVIVIPRPSVGNEDIVPRAQYFADRTRLVSTSQPYPTILTKVWLKQSPKAQRYDVRGSDLREAMYLDDSELLSVLPPFEDDSLVVGYDSAWWFVASRKYKAVRFPERVEFTFHYTLALSMLVYVLNAEVDRELVQERRERVQDRRGWTTGQRKRTLERRIAAMKQLRGEVEDLLKGLAPESFSTWVSDVRLFKSILDRWMVSESSDVLRSKMTTVNAMLRESFQERSEHKQNQLTKLATIFAGSSLIGTVVACIALVFTQANWETKTLTGTILIAFGKVILVALLIGLPVWLFQILVPRWGSQLDSALDLGEDVDVWKVPGRHMTNRAGKERGDD